MRKPRRKPIRRIGLKVWAAAIAVVVALFFVGDSNPHLRLALEQLLQEIITGEPAREQHAGKARIIDGDTLDVSGTRVRLYGIDAPETAQTCRRRGQDWACGKDASKALTEKIGDRSITCDQQDKDRYERVVAVCHAGSQNLNAWMIQNGWAVAYRQYGGTIYDSQESAARIAGRGIWGSEFVMPWDWRKGAR